MKPSTSTLLLLACLAGAYAPLSATAAEPGQFTLQKPIDCTIGTDCFIQQYMDHDPGEGAKDYRCGSEVYDGHDGTDFRVPDKRAQAKGVAVLAAADGVVMRLRDGVPDFDAGAYDPAKVDSAAQCGNGVVIYHRDGWQTQYCHLREGSIRVKAGDVVTAGTVLGMVGQSGQAAFIHLHLTVRHDDRPVDPFAFGEDACGEGRGTSLWREADSTQMAYREAQVINAGFSAGPVKADEIERGGIPAPTASSPALVFYVRAISLIGGDVQSLTLEGPDGAVLATSTLDPLERDKAQYQAFAGKKRTQAAWPSGSYRGIYRIVRAGTVIVEKSYTLVMK